MAQKRMFSLKIVDTDEFLDMPQSTQNLYFHLGMRADDEGFVGNQKRIMRMIGSSEDDKRVLIAKKFILEFETGIVVIKHWKMNNYLQKDRIKPTTYLKEKSQLYLKENGSYTLDSSKGEPMYTKCIHSIDKTRLVENSIEEYNTLVDFFNSICTELSKVSKLTATRKNKLKARLKEYSEQELKDMFLKVSKSDFLNGKNNNNWKASFDWLLEPRNIVKVIEGNYDNKTKNKTTMKDLFNS